MREILSNLVDADSADFEDGLTRLCKWSGKQDDILVEQMRSASDRRRAADAELKALEAEYDEMLRERVKTLKVFLDQTPSLQNDYVVGELRQAIDCSYGLGNFDRWWRFAGFPREDDIPAYYPNPLGYFDSMDNHDKFPRVPVVYHLINGDELVYVGSSIRFAARLKQHRRDKMFDSWKAWPFPSEGEARGAEDAQLRGMAVLPKYNLRAAA